MPAEVAVLGLLALLLLLLAQPPVSINQASVSAIDSNKVKVTVNDTIPDYLLGKLQAGNNITLTLLNSGGDENILISGSGSGSDTNKVGISVFDTGPDYLFSKLEAGPGVSLTLQNSGGDENILIQATGSAGDTNCLGFGSCPTIVYQTGNAKLKDLNVNDLNAGLNDLNASQDCPTGQHLESVGLVKTCSGTNYADISGKPYVPTEGDIDANALAVINSLDLNNSLAYLKTSTGGKTYTSGTPATIQVDNDANTISQNFDGNFYSKLNPLVPWTDANILNSAQYKANCDNNISCTITGKITTGLTIDANHIKFTGTLSGGDFNQSILDHNDSFSCPGEAIQTIGNTTGCVSVSSGTDSNKVAVSVTDTTPDYLFGKLQAGTGVSLTIQNGGGDENILVSSINDLNSGLCTLIVATVAGDYNNIPDAVDALASSGGRVCVKSGTYQLTRTIDINNDNIEIWGEGVTTSIRTNPLAVSPAIRIGDNTQHSNIRLKSFSILASSSLGNGTAIDASNFAIGHIEDIYINGYNRGIDFNKNNTFYNMVDNVRVSVSGINAFGIRFNNGANENTVLRTRIITDGNGTGVLLVNSHGNTLYETNVESGSAVGIDVNTGADDTTIIGPYLESNIINLRLASGVESTTVIGGTIETGTTADIQNNGALGYTQLGTQVTFAVSRNQLASLDLNGTLHETGNAQFDSNIIFYGTLSGGDFNYSIYDANNWVSVQSGLDVNYLNTTGPDRLNGDLDINGILDINGTGAAFAINTAAGVARFSVNTTNDTVAVGGIRPRTDNTFDFGSLTQRLRDGFFSRNLEVDGNINVDQNLAVGYQIKQAVGTNKCIGYSVLSAGAVTVSTNCIDGNSLVFLTRQTAGSAVGTVYISARTPGTSFVITSSNAGDDANVAWWIIRPI